MPRILWLAIPVAAAVLLLVYLLVRRPRAVVIGREAAEGVRREEAWRAEGDQGAQGVLAGRAYAEGAPYDPRPEPLDQEIRGVVGRYRRDEAGRAALCRSLSADDAYLLLGFAHRAAVFTLRERDAAWAADAAAAVTMVDPERIDFRDVLVATAYVHYAAGRVAARADGLLREAARLGGPGSGLVGGFADRPTAGKDLKIAWEACEVDTPAGAAFVRWEGKPYQPTGNLWPLLYELAEVVRADDYGYVTPALATELPEYWLGRGGSSERGIEGAGDQGIKGALAGVRAVVSLNATLREGKVALAISQMFMVWVAEMRDEAGASEIARRAVEAKRDWSVLTVARGRLVCVVVARAVMDGHAMYESGERLKRFERVIGRVLGKYGR